MSAHTMPSWNSLLPHTVNSWTLFYKRQVTFSFVQTPIQALTLINWLWPHVLSALANSQRADMEGGRFVMEQRKNDKKGNLWFTKQRSREVSRCTHAQTYSKHLHLIICIPHTCLFRLSPPHAHFVCLLCNRLQMWCWGGEVFVCHLLGRLRVHPSEGDAVSPDRRGPGLRWWGWGWGKRVTAYAHLEALQVSRAWQPERWDASTWPEQHSMESMQQSGRRTRH